MMSRNRPRNRPGTGKDNVMFGPAADWRRGFTLIELLIVVGIIAVLAAIALPNFLEAQVRARVSRSLADLHTISQALEAYRADNQKIPPPTYPSSVINWWGFVPKNLTTPVAY